MKWMDRFIERHIEGIFITSTGILLCMLVAIFML